MKKDITYNLFTEIAAAIFILLFLYTGISKLIEHKSFALVLAQSPLLKEMSALLSWIVPILEITTSIVLFFPRSRKQGLIISLVLMVSFTGYIGYMLLFTPYLPCSCGGIINEMNWTQHFFFNLLLVFLAIFGLWLLNKNKFFIAINRNS